MRTRLDIIKEIIKEELEGNSNENSSQIKPATQSNSKQDHINHLKAQIDHHTSQLMGWGMPSGDTPSLVARSYLQFHRAELEKLQGELRRLTGGR